MPSMYEIYERHSGEYDELVNAEDCYGRFARRLREVVDWRGRRVIEAGVGTGRVTRIYLEQAARAICFDRSPHMLDAARRNLAAFTGELELAVADNLALPAVEPPADLFVEGWSWGHVVVDHDAEVDETVELLIENARKNLAAEGRIVLIETMGTNTPSATPPNEALARYYRILEERYELRFEIIATDYRFESTEEAARIMGFFFGPAMADAVRAADLPIVPEWTGIWHGPLPRRRASRS